MEQGYSTTGAYWGSATPPFRWTAYHAPPARAPTSSASAAWRHPFHWAREGPCEASPEHLLTGLPWISQRSAQKMAMQQTCEKI
jgi:hypothetical protein